MECKWSCHDMYENKVYELIDTLWNVNPAGHDEVLSLSGINRYIMECKFEVLTQKAQNNEGINRYIMECKYEWLYINAPVQNGINRYIMECK